MLLRTRVPMWLAMLFRQTPLKMLLPHGIVDGVGENLKNHCMVLNLECLRFSYQTPCYLKTRGVVTLISVLHLRIARAAVFDLVLPLVLVQVQLFPLIGVVQWAARLQLRVPVLRHLPLRGIVTRARGVYLLRLLACLRRVGERA